MASPLPEVLAVLNRLGQFLMQSFRQKKAKQAGCQGEEAVDEEGERRPDDFLERKRQGALQCRSVCSGLVFLFYIACKNFTLKIEITMQIPRYLISLLK